MVGLTIGNQEKNQKQLTHQSEDSFSNFTEASKIQYRKKISENQVLWFKYVKYSNKRGFKVNFITEDLFVATRKTQLTTMDSDLGDIWKLPISKTYFRKA